MTSKLENLKANEKAAEARAKTLAAKCKSLKGNHAKAFDARPSNAKNRKNAPEIAALVEEAQQKRYERNREKRKREFKREEHN